MSLLDLEAELAAFEAEVGALAEKVPESVVDAAAAPPPAPAPAAAAATGAAKPAPQATPEAPRAAAGADGLSGTKRKQPAPSNGTAAAAADGAPAAKRAHAAPAFIVSSTPAAVLDDAAQQRSAVHGGAYAHLVNADLAALQQRQSAQAAAAAAAAASASSHAAAADSSAAATASTAASTAAATGGYIPGQVYNGWLASVDPVTGAPMWVEATPEQIEAANANARIEAQAAAEAAAAAAAAAKKAAKKERKLAAKQGGAASAVAAVAADGSGTGGPGAPGSKHHLRTAAGKVWDDPTLADWPDNDYRLFCGDLGNEVSEPLLVKLFERWGSFVKAKVVRDKRTGKSKGFGFASFTDPDECIQALKECDGKYVGNRPIRLRKSEWEKREAGVEKSWTAKHNQFGNSATRGNKKLHLY